VSYEGEDVSEPGSFASRASTPPGDHGGARSQEKVALDYAGEVVLDWWTSRKTLPLLQGVRLVGADHSVRPYDFLDVACVPAIRTSKRLDSLRVEPTGNGRLAHANGGLFKYAADHASAVLQDREGRSVLAQRQPRGTHSGQLATACFLAFSSPRRPHALALGRRLFMCAKHHNQAAQQAKPAVFCHALPREPLAIRKRDECDPCIDEADKRRERVEGSLAI